MKEYLNGLQHIGILVKDFDKTCVFYKQIGFEEAYSTKQPNGGKAAFYKLGDLMLELYESSDWKGISGTIDHFSIDCSDIDKAYAEVTAMGAAVVSNGIEALPYWEHGIRFFTIKSPNGEKVEFCMKL